MKKILAFCLFLLLALGACLPVFGAANVSEFDKTTADDKMDLVVTEVLINSKTGQDSLDNVQEAGSVSKFSSPDAFDYIEIYNRGTTAINLYSLQILSANSRDFTGTSNQSTQQQNEDNKYLFKFQNLLVPGSIHDEGAGNAASGSLGEYNACVNPATAVLQPGQIAVIWFWTTATDQLCNKLGQTDTPVGTQWSTDLDPSSRYFPYFRNYYGIADDVLVVATNAKASKPTGSNSADVFNDLRNGYTYAFVKNSYNFGTKCYTAVNGLNNNILTMFEYSTNTDVGILTTDNMDDVAATYVPANCTPDLYNANQRKNVGDSWAAKVDYVQISGSTVSMGKKYVRSYRECAVVTYTEEPTPGSMPAWQWYYVQSGTVGSGAYAHSLKLKEEAVFAAAADKAAFDAAMSRIVTDWATNTAIKDANGRLLAEGTGANNWPAKAKAQFLLDYVAGIIEVEDHVEEKKDYQAYLDWVWEYTMTERPKYSKQPDVPVEDPPSSTEQEAGGQVVETDNNPSIPEEEKGLPGYAVVLIVVGSVVFVALIGLGIFAVVYSARRKEEGEASFAPAQVDAPVDFMGLVASLRQGWETCKQYPLAPNVAHCANLVKTLLSVTSEEKARDLLVSMADVLKMMKPAVLQNATVFASLASSVDAMLEGLEKT